MFDDYAARNYDFVTSTKLREFARCPFCYKLKFVDLIDDPTEGEEFFDKEALTIGRAVDDRLTYGEEFYAANYESVKRRSKESTGKTQLTEGQSKTIDRLGKEFLANNLFYHQPKKEVIIFQFDEFKIKAELDDFDLENRIIRDVKTCANVETFNPDYYLWQMSFYQWAVEEKYNVKCKAILEVVDKYKYFARSLAVLFREETLESNRGTILTTLDNLRICTKNNEWDQARGNFNCPFYGVKDSSGKAHGRPDDYLYI